MSIFSEEFTERYQDLSPHQLNGLDRYSILLAYRGSHTHGTYIPPGDKSGIDDVDLIGVCVPDLSYYIGLDNFGSRGTVEIRRDEWDIVIYEARKALSMLASGNPNILSLLWLRPQDYIYISYPGQMILDNRDLFVGRHVFQSFAGYANSQLKRMTATNKEGYMGQKRLALVQEFGYDTKNAAHLIRLLRMCIEFLDTGQLQVWRRDARELTDIKRGRWSLERVKAEAEDLFEQARLAHERSPLPDQADHERINELCVGVVRQTLESRQLMSAYT